MKALKWYSLRRKILVYRSWDFSHNTLKYTLFHSLEFNISKAEKDKSHWALLSLLITQASHRLHCLDCQGWVLLVLAGLFSGRVCVCVCLPVCYIKSLNFSGTEHSACFSGVWFPGWDYVSTPDVAREKTPGRRVPIFPNEMRQNKWERTPWLVQRTESVRY